MRLEASMGKRRRRKFTGEFKKEAVRLFREGERSIGQVAKELDLTESALRNWVKQYKVDHGEGPRESLTTAERDELGSLRSSHLCRQARNDAGPIVSRERLGGILNYYCRAA